MEFPTFFFSLSKVLSELNLGALEMLSVTLWRRRSFSCYFCSQETPSAPSIFLPCCESPVNRFLSVFVGNMLPLTPPGCSQTPTLSVWRHVGSTAPSLSTRCDHNQSLPCSSLGFLQSAGHVTSFVLHTHTVRLHATLFLLWSAAKSLVPSSGLSSSTERERDGWGRWRKGGRKKREREKGEPNRM